MADNRVIFEVITTSKGTKVVQQQTEDLAKSVDKVDKNTKGLDKTQEKNYGRQKQGVIQTANGTKNFSKMAQTIGGGSSGLVGAYATLAANVFAASAAFNFLKNSARFDVLTEGITALGDQSGRTLSVMAERLREVTGEAISVEESFRSAALGISGGFGEEELAGLAKVAKGASIALGRDLGDAFDRLTRGAIKLEPEILDELGIMVRLDDAVDNYATVLGKSASSLTQLERRQAFMNAILEQGEIKFGAIAEKVDTNPYDRLGAAFSDLARQLGQILNVAIIPFVELLASNIGFLISGSLLLASTFAKQMVPSLLQGGKAAHAAALQLAGVSAAAKNAANDALQLESKGVGAAGVGSKDSQIELKNIERSNGQRKVSKELITSLRRSKGQLARQEAKMSAAGSKFSKIEIADQNTKIANTEARIQQLIRMQGQQLQSSLAGTGETSADLRGMVQGDIGDILDESSQRTPMQSLKGIPADFGKVTESAKTANHAFRDFTKQQEKMGNKVSSGAKALFRLKLGATAAGGGMRILGAAFLNAIPFIGQAIFGITMLVQAFKWFTKNEPLEKLNKSLEDLDTILEGVTGKTEEFNRINAQVKDPFQKLVAGYTVASGLIDETVTALEKVLKKQQEIDNANKNKNPWWESTLFSASGNVQENIEKAAGLDDPSLQKALGVDIELNFSKENKKDLTESGIFKTLEELRAGPQIVQDVLNSKLDLTELISGGADTDTILEAVTKGLVETKNALKETGPALQDLQAEFKNTENTMSTFFNKAFPKTKFDDVAKQFVSLTNSFDTAVGKIAISLGENGDTFLESMDLTNVGDGLKRQFAQATAGAGSNLDSLMPSSVANSDTALLATMDARIAKEEEIANIHKNMMGPMDATSVAQAEKQLVKLGDQLAILEQQEGVDENLVKLKGEALASIRDEFNELQRGARLNASLNKLATARIKTLKSAVKQTEVLNFTIDEQNKIGQRNIDQLNDEIGILQARADAKEEAGEKDVQLEAYITSLIAQKATEQEKLTDPLERQLKLKTASVALQREELKVSKELTTATNTQVKNQMALENFKRTGSTDLDPEQQFKADVAAAKQKRDMAISEIELRFEMLAFESQVVQMRIAATAAELRSKGRGAEAEQLEAGAEKLASSAERAKVAMQASLKAVGSTFELEITNAMVKSLGGATTGQAVANVQKLIAERGKNAYQEVVTAAGTAAYDEAIKAGVSESTAQVLKTNAEAGAKDPGGAASQAEEKARELTMGDAASMIGPQIEALKKLGPEGELVAAATQGVFTIGAAFSTLGDTASSASAKAAAGMSILTSINDIMQASSKAKMAGIDQDIEAEKKRDGKSEESVAKIKALEKKKEAIARKAFEMNKKMQIAGALVDTASAVTGALGKKPWSTTNVILAAAMGALGLAQVAMIRKTQFQGAGGDVPAVQNTALTIGGRSNNVDVAQGVNQGEQAYMRGSRGVGTNANDFTPGGAMGRKGYASGGMIVGERGPEIVTKDEIIPNYALGKGGETNVVLNISAIDGQSVATMFSDQQGNIIQMIRDAANDNGEAFLETVDPTVYGGSAG